MRRSRTLTYRTSFSILRTRALRLHASHSTYCLLSTAESHSVWIAWISIYNIQYVLWSSSGFYTLRTGILVNWQRDVDVRAYMRLAPRPSSECRHDTSLSCWKMMMISTVISYGSTLDVGIGNSNDNENEKFVCFAPWCAVLLLF